MKSVVISAQLQEETVKLTNLKPPLQDSFRPVPTLVPI